MTDETQETPPAAKGGEGGAPAEVLFEAQALDVLERMGDAFVALDRDWRVVYANREACRINQKPLQDFLGDVHWAEWPGAAGTELERQFRRVMDERVAVHFEHRYVSGLYDVWLEIDAYPSVGGMNLFYRDISARKRIEERLLQFQFLSDNANDAFFLLDEAGRFLYVNAAACRSLGYTDDQFRGMRPSDIDPFYDDAEFRSLFLRTDGERLPPFESLHRRADGSLFPVEASVSRVNVGGQALLFSSCRDITERKQAQDAMHSAVARQRAFLRDVLASVTEGRLVLCERETDLPPQLTPLSEPLPLSSTGGLRDLRRETGRACHAVGLSEERCQDLVTAVSEAGMNAVVHVGAGMGQVFADADVVRVWITDRGGGIALENLPNATLRKGYTTAGTLGHGMKIMLQTADHIYLLTGSTGTTVVIEQGRGAPSPV